MPKNKSGNFNQLEYIDKFNKETYKSFSLRIRKDNIKVLNKLASVPNKTDYIVKLIEKDIHDQDN